MDVFAYELLEAIDRHFGAPPAGRERRDKVLTAEAEVRLSRILSVRRAMLYYQLVWEKTRAVLAKRWLLAKYSFEIVPPKELRDALERVMEDLEREGGTLLRREYPELDRLDGLLSEGFARFIDEVIQEVEDNRREISAAFFGGRDFGRITLLRLPDETDASTRPGGRAALRIESEGGVFYYKPRDCTVEQVYTRLTERFFPEMEPTCRCVVGKSASFTEHVETVPLSSEAEAEEYYRRMGVLTALFFVLLSNDMHGNNFIPNGSRPVPIDMETFLTPIPIGMKLPEVHVSSNDFMNYRGGSSPLFLPPAGIKPRSGLPHLNGHPVTVLERKESFLEGFNEGYRRIQANAGGILSLLSQYPNMELRFTPNSRSVYRRIQQYIVQPNQLRSTRTRDMWLKKLRPHVPDRLGLGIGDEEINDLLNLDMPDFIIRAGGTSAFRADGSVVSEGRLRSPLSLAEQRLGSLSDRERQTACDEISDLFASINGSL